MLSKIVSVRMRIDLGFLEEEGKEEVRRIVKEQRFEKGGAGKAPNWDWGFCLRCPLTFA